MAKRDIVVLGGSTGSFDAFKTIAAGLPGDLEVSIFIVWHMAPEIRGILPQVLNRYGRLHASEAREGERIQPGRIYVARPDHHLLIEDGHVRVARGPKENRFRPAVDPLFRSAAYSHGPRVVGIIMSGALDDGTSGLWTVKHRGGVAVVQDPNDAEIPSMPESALREVDVDHVVKSTDIADLITSLSQEEVSEMSEADRNDEHGVQTKKEIDIAGEDNALRSGIMQLGDLTPFTCPECHGVLSRIHDGERPRFRCHTGHAFTADSLLSALTQNVEDSLWGAVRGVDETIMLLNHIGDHFADANNGSLAAKFFQKASEAQRRNELIRSAVLNHELLTTELVEESPDVVAADEAGNERE